MSKAAIQKLDELGEALGDMYQKCGQVEVILNIHTPILDELIELSYKVEEIKKLLEEHDNEN